MSRVVSRWAIDIVVDLRMPDGKMIYSDRVHGTFDVLARSGRDDRRDVVGYAHGSKTHYRHAFHEVDRGFMGRTTETFYPDCSLTVPQSYDIDGLVFNNTLDIRLHGKLDRPYKTGFIVRYVYHDAYIISSPKTWRWTRLRTWEEKPCIGHSVPDIPLTHGWHDLPTTGSQHTNRVSLTNLFADTVPCEIILRPPPSTVYVPCDGSYEPHILAEAPGGRSDYNWTLMRGTERASLVGATTNRVANIRLFGPSIVPDDVAVQVSYIDADGQRKKCERSFSVSRPTKLEVLDERDVPLVRLPNGMWYMGVERHYQVHDQFDQLLLIYGLDVTETLRGIDVHGNTVSWSTGTRRISFNPGNANFVGPGARAAQIEAKSTRTDGEGCFYDTPHLSDFQPFPEETDFIIFQEVQVEGCVVRNNTIHFLKDSVAIAP